VINWINGRCSSSSDSDEKLIECYLPYDWSYISSNFRQILPVLTFRLSEDGIELNLPLEEFIQDKKVIVGQFGNETHLTFNVGVNPYASLSRYLPRLLFSHPSTQLTHTTLALSPSDSFSHPFYLSVIIIFGLPAIETLYTVFDYTHTRIAFGQRPQHIFEDTQGWLLSSSYLLFVSSSSSPFLLSSLVKRGGCKVRSVCAMGKTYNPQTNACMDPACHVYYFQELDPETNQCRLVRTITFLSLLFSSTVLPVPQPSFFTPSPSPS
jgi:hypothetical protein